MGQAKDRIGISKHQHQHHPSVPAATIGTTNHQQQLSGHLEFRVHVSRLVL